jgi:hypothetical protein
MAGSKHSATRGWLRRFTLGSGPLKRGSDRVQVMGRVVLALSFVLAPPLAVAAATAATAHYEAIAATQRAERVRTSAVLQEDAPTATHPSGGAGDDSLPTHVLARASWTVPGGTVRTGLLPVEPRTAAGTAVRVWVSRDGDLTGAPLDRSSITGTAATMGALPLIGIPAVTWALYAALCAALDARRQRRWTQDWAAVEPEWNSRLL